MHSRRKLFHDRYCIPLEGRAGMKQTTKRFILNKLSHGLRFLRPRPNEHCKFSKTIVFPFCSELRMRLRDIKTVKKIPIQTCNNNIKSIVSQ